MNHINRSDILFRTVVWPCLGRPSTPYQVYKSMPSFPFQPTSEETDRKTQKENASSLFFLFPPLLPVIPLACLLPYSLSPPIYVDCYPPILNSREIEYGKPSPRPPAQLGTRCHYLPPQLQQTNKEDTNKKAALLFCCYCLFFLLLFVIPIFDVACDESSIIRNCTMVLWNSST